MPLQQMRGPSVCMSVTLMHPAKTAGCNEMPFGRETRVVPRNTVLDRGPSTPWKEKNWGLKPTARSDVAYHQIILALVMYYLLATNGLRHQN